MPSMGPQSPVPCVSVLQRQRPPKKHSAAIGPGRESRIKAKWIFYVIMQEGFHGQSNTLRMIVISPNHCPGPIN